MLEDRALRASPWVAGGAFLCPHMALLEECMSKDLPPFFPFMLLEFGLRAWSTCKAGLYPLSHTSSPFCSGYFGNGIFRTICPEMA
jgi:hypothetical protein